MFNNQNKDNNPFEAGNKPQPAANQYQARKNDASSQTQTRETASQSNLVKKKSKMPKIIVGVLFVLFFIMAFSDIEYLLYDISYSIEQRRELARQEDYIVEDYKYDFNDFNGSIEQDPFPEEIPQGKAFTITKDHEKYIKRADSTELTLIVGEDVEPGLYTILYEGDDLFQIDLAFDSFFPNEPAEYYNIPLVEGDKIESTYFKFTDDSTVVFTPQTEYIEFQDGYSGIFVYGLSNFESKIELDSADYSEIIYRYYSPKYEYLATNSYYNEDATLNGIPASYFIIEYDNETSYL